jgi:hypothetical protein
VQPGGSAAWAAAAGLAFTGGLARTGGSLAFTGGNLAFTGGGWPGDRKERD